YRIFGRGESQISQAARGLIEGAGGAVLPDRGSHGPEATIHYQVKFPEILVKLVVRDADRDRAEAHLAHLDAGLRERLAPYLYSTGDETRIERVVRRAIDAGATIATAESCTGGMIGEMLTRMPGSSRAFLGGAIVYSNAEKERQLGVRRETLEAHGAVSEETV